MYQLPVRYFLRWSRLPAVGASASLRCARTCVRTHHTHVQDLHTGYLSSDSRAHREFALARQFYVKQGQPYYAAAFIRAKDNGSLLRQEYFE